MLLTKLPVAVGLAGVALAANAVTYTPGTYTEKVNGHNAAFTVKVTVSKNKIEKIEYPDNLETIGVGKVALDMDRSNFAVRQEFSHTARELHQQHAGILASAYGDQYLVAVFNQVEVVESLGDFSTDAFADGVGHWE